MRGVPTTRYAAVVDLAARTLRQNFGGPGGVLNLRVDVWIDRDGLIRRVQWTAIRRRRIRRLHQRLGFARAIAVTELWDFGLPVNIELPDVEPLPSGIRGWLALGRRATRGS